MSEPQKPRLEVYPDREMFDRIDRWRAKQLPIPTRARAARILINKALDQEEEKEK